jgi:hypothetical protein
MIQLERYLPYISGTIPSCGDNAWSRLKVVKQEGSEVDIQCGDRGGFTVCGGCIYDRKKVRVDLQQVRSQSLDPHAVDGRGEQDSLQSADEY